MASDELKMEEVEKGWRRKKGGVLGSQVRGGWMVIMAIRGKWHDKILQRDLAGIQRPV